MHTEGALIAKGFDIIQASIIYPMAMVFPKSRAGAYAPAVNICRGAAQYGEADIEGVLMHFVAFDKTLGDMSRAATVIGNMKGYSGLLIYAGGHLQDWWKVSKALVCFRDSQACNDVKAHCYVIPVDSNQVFPCRHLHYHGFRYSLAHPSTYADQLQAGAVREGCAWCPNFNATTGG